MAAENLTFSSQGTTCTAWHYPDAHDGLGARSTPAPAGPGRSGAGSATDSEEAS